MSHTTKKKVRFEEKVQVFVVPKHDDTRNNNEWIRRKIDFERRVCRLEALLSPILQPRHLDTLLNHRLSDDDDDFEIVFE